MTDQKPAYATFHVMGDSVVPAFWTGYFDVKPDIAIIKGEPFTTPSGRVSRTPGRVGLWGFGSKAFVVSDALEPHLRFLVERLDLARPDLHETLKRKGVKVRFWCYWDKQIGNRVPDVPNDIRAMMEALGGTIEIDGY
ncbi:MAG: DUF4279 domain-containing protein [Paraburkholderia sp.]